MCLFNRWEATTEKLSYLGFGGAIIPFPKEDTVEGNLQYLHKDIQKLCFRPPVLITHSLGTFLGQKYLESFPLTGLIMVNPLPHNSGNAFQSLQQRWDTDAKQQSEIDRLHQYYRWNQPRDEKHISYATDHAPSTLVPDSLASDWMKNAAVELEPESVPMLIVTTKDDGNIISPQEYEEFLDYHNIDRSCNIVLEKDETRLPMLASSEEFHRHVLQWTDDVA